MSEDAAKPRPVPEHERFSRSRSPAEAGRKLERGGPASVEVFNGPESAFFVTSALVIGTRSAVLVDAQFTRSAGRELAEWVAGKRRDLTAIVITNGYPDHYFGVEEVLRLFPGAALCAAPEVVAVINQTAMAKVAQWRPAYGDDLTEHPLVPQPLAHGGLQVDGHELRVISLGQGSGPDGTIVHVPSARTVLAGDFVYNGTHVWTADTTPDERQEWLANLERIGALGAVRLIAGHRAPGWDDDAGRVLHFTAEYLRDFDAMLAEYPDDTDALVAAVNATYGQLTEPVILHLGAAANTSRQGHG